jgi:hypothetical protein
LGWLLATKAAVQQPPTLASTNFSEIGSANGKCRLNLVNFAAQFRDLGSIVAAIRSRPMYQKPRHLIYIALGSELYYMRGVVQRGWIAIVKMNLDHFTNGSFVRSA